MLFRQRAVAAEARARASFDYIFEINEGGCVSRCFGKMHRLSSCSGRRKWSIHFQIQIIVCVLINSKVSVTDNGSVGCTTQNIV